MKENLSHKIDSIFQIKIKEDKICNVFRSLEQKILAISHQLADIQHTQTQSPFSADEDKAKKYIQTLVTQITRPINERLLQHQHILNNIKYNHQNLCHNMGEQFKGIANQFQNDINQIRARLVTEESRIKEDLEVQKIRVQENQLLFNQFVNENTRKGRDFQIKIENIWDVIRSIRKNIDDIATKQPTKQLSNKHAQFKQIKQNEGENRNQKINKPAKRNTSSNELSILKNHFSQDKNLQYASILTKIDALETKFKQLSSNLEKQSQKVVSSKRKIGTDNEIEDFGSNMDFGLTIIENRKKSKEPRQSRFGRSSIRTEEAQNSIIKDVFHDKERKKMETDIKKLSEKYSQIMYKYTLLQQNYEIILNKLPRISQIEASVQLKADEIQKIRVDFTTINEIKIRYRKMQSIFQEQEDKYVPKKLYAQQYDSLKDAIKQIQAFSLKLSKQDEVKQAFLFIENKIKQIVVVLTDKFEVDREGAINKVHQVKCLTCDKQIQSNSLYQKLSTNTSSQVFSRGKKYRNTRGTLKRAHTEDC